MKVLESPLDRIQNLGIRGAPTLDLLSVAISRVEGDVAMRVQPAQDWMKRSTPAQILDFSPLELQKLSGLEGFDVQRMLCLIEIGRRGARDSKTTLSTVDGFPDVEKIFEELKDERKEHFCALFLNSKNGVLARSTIHIGTVSMSVVGAREVFREAVRLGAASVIVVHNHPSGDPAPSPEDIAVTKKLAEAGLLLDVPLLDHVIIGDPKSFSFRQRGML